MRTFCSHSDFNLIFWPVSTLGDYISLWKFLCNLWRHHFISWLKSQRVLNSCRVWAVKLFPNSHSSKVNVEQKTLDLSWKLKWAQVRIVWGTLSRSSPEPCKVGKIKVFQQQKNSIPHEGTVKDLKIGNNNCFPYLILFLYLIIIKNFIST